MNTALRLNDDSQIVWRDQPLPADIAAVTALVRETGVFSDEEIVIAGELVEECLAKGETESGYSFLFADGPEGLLGYSCFGRIPMTEQAWDLYWIAVRPDSRSSGLAGVILALSEENVRAGGGTQFYAETSGTAKYAPAQRFYLKNGFKLSATFEDFYKPGDSKLVFRKDL